MIWLVVDAAQHRLRVRRGSALDGDAQALGGVSRRAVASSTRDRRRERAGEPARSRRKRILQAPVRRERAMSGAAAAGRGVRRSPGTRSRRSRWRGRWRGAATRSWSRPGSTGARRSRAMGLGFAAAQEYQTFPPPPARRERGRRARPRRRSRCSRCSSRAAPDVVVSDILTLAPALAAEAAGVRAGDADPARVPGARAGAAVLRLRGAAAADRRSGGRCGGRRCPLLEAGCERGRDELNETRAQVGLPPLERFHGGISESWRWSRPSRSSSTRAAGRPTCRVTGPMPFELPYPDVELPPGDAPLVLVAPSTAQDPDCRLVRVALEALADEPVRVLATTNRHAPRRSPLPPAPPNARRGRLAPLHAGDAGGADLVVCHGGHGTVARALAAGAPVLCCPAVGDMAENGARVAWAGAGLMLPWRLAQPAALRARGAPDRSAIRRFASGRARSRPGPRTTTAPSAAPSWSSSLSARCVRAPGVGLEPTTSRLTAERSAN